MRLISTAIKIGVGTALYKSGLWRKVLPSRFSSHQRTDFGRSKVGRKPVDDYPTGLSDKDTFGR